MGQDAVFMVRTDRPDLLPEVEGGWRQPNRYEAYIGCTHVYHPYWRYFSPSYPRGYWPEQRALLVRLMELGPTWYMSDICCSPADVMGYEALTEENFRRAGQSFTPITDEGIAERDEAWANIHRATSAPTTTPTASQQDLTWPEACARRR